MVSGLSQKISGALQRVSGSLKGIKSILSVERRGFRGIPEAFHGVSEASQREYRDMQGVSGTFEGIQKGISWLQGYFMKIQEVSGAFQAERSEPISVLNTKYKDFRSSSWPSRHLQPNPTEQRMFTVAAKVTIE